MGKNIVICCDGTGQKLDIQRTNVVQLFNVLDRTNLDAQIAYYDPGVGTIPATGALTWVSRQLTLKAGLLFGYGLLENVSEAYSFLVDRYEEGDRVYLFGFSRGAFTVRVLAGLLHRIGVLYPAGKNLIPYALELYKPHYTKITDAGKQSRIQSVMAAFRRMFGRPGTSEIQSLAADFRQMFCRPGTVEIKFLGLWDTVKAFGILWPQSLPHTRHNPAVTTVRHALALDESRRSFVPTSWGGIEGSFEAPAPPGQDVKEVWFIGSHSDVGGGYCEEESGLSRISLKWMIDEAQHCCPELRLDKEQSRRMSEHSLELRQPIDLNEGYWKLHRSRTPGWCFFDLVPRPVLTNAPPRRHKDKPEDLEPELPVPRGWPKRRVEFWPITGRRQPEKFKRGPKVLIHKSVRELAQSGKYHLKVDNRIVKYEGGSGRMARQSHLKSVWKHQ